MRLSRVFIFLTALALLLMSVGCKDGSEVQESGTETVALTFNSDGDVFGEVSYVADSYISVKVVSVEGGVPDPDNYALVGETKFLPISESTKYYSDISGERVAVSVADIKQDMLVVAEKNGNGYDVIALAGAPINGKVVEVSGVSGDGVLTLTSYMLKDGVDYRPRDAAKVEFDNYASSGMSEEYEIPADAVVMRAENGKASPAEASAIAAGDMLVIYMEDGVTTVVVHRG